MKSFRIRIWGSLSHVPLERPRVPCLGRLSAWKLPECVGGSAFLALCVFLTASAGAAAAHRLPDSESALQAPVGVTADREAATRGSVSLQGAVPVWDFPDIQQISDRIWAYLMQRFGLGAETTPPYIYFHAFDRRNQSPEWTAWQNRWIRFHPEIWRDWTALRSKEKEITITQEWIDDNIIRVFPFPRSFLAFHYDGTNRIQINPIRTFGASVRIDPYGRRRDLNGRGYYSVSHEMVHYALELKGVVPTKLHHCLMIRARTIDNQASLMGEVADYLIENGIVSSGAKIRGLINERSFEPCSSLTSEEIQRVETILAGLNL